MPQILITHTHPLFTVVIFHLYNIVLLVCYTSTQVDYMGDFTEKIEVRKCMEECRENSFERKLLQKTRVCQIAESRKENIISQWKVWNDRSPFDPNFTAN